MPHPPSPASRRDFLRSSAITAAFLGLRSYVAAAERLGAPASPAPAGFGRLRPDRAGLLDLPQGFSYRRFSRTGEPMDDGLLVPGMHDGMAAFPGPDGRVVLVRNHEMEPQWTDRSPFGPDAARLARIPDDRIYDRGHGRRPNLGGTTTLLYDPASGHVERQFLSLAGTARNCAGGPTPWGTWITCEEVNDDPAPDDEKPHGYNFEVRPTPEPALTPPVPLKAMGRFRHEAVAVDPASGIVYQTEDWGDGLITRFIPREKGNLAAGGRLQALVPADPALADPRNWPDTASAFPLGRLVPVRWMDLDDVDNPGNDLRRRAATRGAAIFARGEGMWHGHDSVWWVCTNGGPKLLGQVFRYRPSPHEGTPGESTAPGHLELFVQSTSVDLMRNGDNLTVAPWGDLIVCEDTDAPCRLVGITPGGAFYHLARNAESDSEFAGACFSPDGSTLFVNVQSPGYTLAITGPWPRATTA